VGCKSGERPFAPHDKTRRTAVFRDFVEHWRSLEKSC
jgi:hypothetical protein